jgi:TRAP-type mannitol/chloroaromatic compound transport system substrate-binding protein
MTIVTTRRGAFALGVGAGIAAPARAHARAARRWRCVTSWARNMPGPGVSARRISEAITAMSQGDLVVDVFAAGEIVPALQVFDAVSGGSVELAHSASLFWAGKLPVAPVFTTVPFGLTPTAHVGWLAAGGQSLWDELYAPHGVRAFVAGNTGPSAAGWFRREVRSVADFKGLRIRATGIGGEVYAALGATPIAIAPAETYAALERGVIDAVELLAPANDEPAGLHRIARHLVLPGFNKPNGASEMLVNAAAFAALPQHLQLIVETACRAEHDRALAETLDANAQAIRRLVAAGVSIGWLSEDVLLAARAASVSVLARISATSALAARIVESASGYATQTEPWQRATSGSMHAGR